VSEAGREDARRTLADFALPSEPGKEREAMELVAEAVQELGLPRARLERLKTAVAEATMNTMEHGNEYRAEAPVSVRVFASSENLSVLITDRGSSPVPTPGAEAPDLKARLEGGESPRGWGLFLIRNMVDEMNVTTGEDDHTIELVLHLKGDSDAGKTV
jgi:anti-sigma regulatory factor (Ser/Thr protein kinase)